MKKTTIILLLSLIGFGAVAQTQYWPKYGIMKYGYLDSTTVHSFYGSFYLMNVQAGLVRLNADRKFVTTTLTESDIPSLPISKVTGLQDSLTKKANRTFDNVASGSIAASKLVGTDINTVGTITTGTWNATAILDAYISSAATWNTAYTYSQVGHLPLAGGDLTGSITGTDVNWSGMSRSKGWYATGTGHAIENGVISGVGYVLSYDRTSSAFMPLYIEGSDLTLNNNGGAVTIGGTVTAPAIKLTSGANNGYVLKSDASGNATWQSQAAGTVYKGSWDASTNTPILADGTGTAGDMYAVSASGTQFTRSFVAGGWAIYNGTIWESVGTSASVTSVNSLTGGVQVNPTLTGNTIGVTGGTATIDISAATAVAANTAKVTNATHTGDAEGSTALTVKKINGVALSGLATGLLKNTTTTGVPSIAVPGTDYLTPTGSAAGLTNFPILNQNTTGNAETATTAGTVTTAAQPAITSTGTLTSLTVSGSIVGAIGDDATISPDFSKRIGFTKKSGFGPKLTYGNTEPLIIAESNTANIDAANTFTTRVSFTNGGGMEVFGALSATNFSGSVSGTNTGDNATNPTSNTYADGKVADNLTASTTVAPSKTAVNTALALKLDVSTASSTYQTLANLQTDLTASATKYPSVNAVNTGLGLKENTVTAGTTSQYYRGDKSWQTLDKTAVGLPNVDNTSDANKPVSTATQTALDLKANISSLATVATSGAYADLAGKPTLATVATSGSYNDLLNKPSITTGSFNFSGTSATSYNTGVSVVNGTAKIFLTAKTPDAAAVNYYVSISNVGGFNMVFLNFNTAPPTGTTNIEFDYVIHD